MSNAAVCVEVMAPLSSAGDVRFAHLSDQELLTSTRRLVGATNQILAELLAHLAEVEARGVHRERLCTSLYTYCVYELRFSEDAAYRRVSAARLVQRFPALYEAIATGELHLTGLLMLGPHFTAENIAEVLARAKHRTKKEIAKLVRQLDPLPDVPARIVPLGPEAHPLKARKPTYAEYVGSFNPVNHLPAGDRPRDWMSDTPFSLLSEPCEATEASANDATPTSAPARFETFAPLTGPQRYQVQFTAEQEYVDLVERAQALLSHTAGGELAELHLRAMRTLVADLEKRKYALGRKGRAEAEAKTKTRDDTTARGGTKTREGAKTRAEAKTPADPKTRAEAKTRAKIGPGLLGSLRAGAVGVSEKSRGRGRHIPAAVRRAVVARDGQRCAYVDENGRRCAETHRLEFHHVVAFALGGEHSLENVSLRCRCHNALAAEDDFGREVMREAKGRRAHESLARQVAYERIERGASAGDVDQD